MFEKGDECCHPARPARSGQPPPVVFPDPIPGVPLDAVDRFGLDGHRRLFLRGCFAAHQPGSIGVWRSLVARVVRDDEAAGSNPVTPTSKVEGRKASLHLFLVYGPALRPENGAETLWLNSAAWKLGCIRTPTVKLAGTSTSTKRWDHERKSEPSACRDPATGSAAGTSGTADAPGHPVRQLQNLQLGPLGPLDDARSADRWRRLQPGHQRSGHPRPPPPLPALQPRRLGALRPRLSFPRSNYPVQPIAKSDLDSPRRIPRFSSIPQNTLLILWAIWISTPIRRMSDVAHCEKHPPFPTPFRGRRHADRPGLHRSAADRFRNDRCPTRPVRCHEVQQPGFAVGAFGNRSEQHAGEQQHAVDQ